jgi:phage antirepressor YoqD-like protein
VTNNLSFPAPAADLILTVAEGQPYADSRLVATGFGIQHKNLLTTIRSHAETLCEREPLRTALCESGPNRGDIDHYLLTERQVMLLSGLCRTTPDTARFLAHMVDCFLAMRAQLASRAIPTHSEALRLAADAIDRADALAAKIEADAPKVAFAEAVEITAETFTIRDVCKSLSPKPKEFDFFHWLRQTNWIHRHDRTGKWVPHSVRLTDGEMVVATTVRKRPDGTTFVDDDGRTRTDETARFTGKGKVKVTAAWARAHRSEVVGTFLGVAADGMILVRPAFAPREESS